MEVEQIPVIFAPSLRRELPQFCMVPAGSPLVRLRPLIRHVKKPLVNAAKERICEKKNLTSKKFFNKLDMGSRAFIVIWELGKVRLGEKYPVSSGPKASDEVPPCVKKAKIKRQEPLKH